MVLLSLGLAVKERRLARRQGGLLGLDGVAGGAGKHGAKTGGGGMRLGLLGMRMPTSARTALMALMNDGLQAAIN